MSIAARLRAYCEDRQWTDLDPAEWLEIAMMGEAELLGRLEEAKRQDRLALSADYNRAANTVRRMESERNAALLNLEAAVAQRDEAREAWRWAMGQLVKEQARSRQLMRRVLELYEEGARAAVAVRAGLTPGQWMAALEAAKREHPELWREEG